MATRSRTQLYIRHREALRSHRKKVARPPDEKINRNLLDMRAALSDDEGMGDPRVYSIPPVWVVTVQDLKRDVMSIESKIKELSEVSGKHLLPGFGDDEEDHEDAITRTVQEITSLFRECERRLKEIHNTPDEGSGDEAVRKNIEQRVAKQLQDLSVEFRRGHKTYLAKLKGQEIEEYKPDLGLKGSGSAGAASSTGGGFFDDDEEAATTIDPRFNSQQTMALVLAEQMSDERSKQIEQVAESVSELAGIFKEIQVLVIDQGTILDRIDFNIEMAADKVTAATVEIDKANQIQKKSRAMLCIYLLLLLCGSMVLVLIVKKSMGG
eukprot:CAMPEP_0119092048 /NCGR_PEP_ID=MMETSP1178-20130426/158522_1 /TAXON_ID=33656 /ORGANISM="unid sp, Strain CCMP2000" /LENGTH=323 /DNA_ID=CAMNT_0007075599 /DNA_START=16 /DNA_END=987 /DNA_ORIENTATION=-